MLVPWKAFTPLLLILFLWTLPVAAQEDQPAEEESPQELPVGPDALRSPRATMETFLVSVRKERFDEAIETLDFSQLDPEPNAERKKELAIQLKDVIDRMAWVDTASISAYPVADPYRFPPDAEVPPIVIARGADGAWRFTAETVAGIDDLYEQWKSRPKVVKHTPWYRENTPLGNNEVWRLVALFLSLLVAWIVGRLARYILAGIGGRLKNRGRLLSGASLLAVSRAAVPLLLVLGLRVGLHFLKMNPTVEGIASTVTSILFIIAVGWAIFCLVEVVNAWLNSLAEKTESKLDDMLAPMVCTTLRATVVILALVQIATVLSDKPMTSIIAGLGVGGLAVGLAAQDMIKNFFGSIMIFSDRPFELGERVVVAGHDGMIEVVGFRSTRIRTLEGHLVTIPNATIANADIKNIAKRPNIRRILNLGLTYDTPPEKIQRAKQIVEELLQDHEGMDPEFPPRVYFDEFKDASLNLFVIYWYHPPDWWPYNDFSERLNMRILERFNAEGIEFAFPSQTVFLAGDPKRPLSSMPS